MCSFDIESLYTNIPVSETIDICINELFTSDNTTILNMNKKQFKLCLELALNDTYFFFNNDLYKQLNGVAMGSSLGPNVANIFLCYHETNWLDNCPLAFKPVLYRRYLDDTFLLFKKREHISPFLNYLNAQHNNIKFTHEVELNSQIAFLDVNIKRDLGNFETSLYRKPTFTGLGTNFFSFMPTLYKLNCIKTLLSRAYGICSNFKNLDLEFDFLRGYFKQNGYLESTFNKLLNNFLNGKYENKIATLTVPKLDYYITLPYMGYVSSKIKIDLLKILEKRFPQVNFIFAFQNSFKIFSFFNHKERLPKPLCSSVIYKYTCHSCNAMYIGSTLRQFKCRIDEHFGRSSRTDNLLMVQSKSSIRDHCMDKDHAMSVNDFEIIDTCRDFNDLRTLESIHINKLKPKLNDYNSAYELKILN